MSQIMFDVVQGAKVIGTVMGHNRAQAQARLATRYSETEFKELLPTIRLRGDNNMPPRPRVVSAGRWNLMK